MKNMALSLSALLLSTFAFAQEPAVTTKAVVFDANDIQQSTVNVIAPAGGVVTIGIDGNDMFITGEENSTGVELVLDRKTETIEHKLFKDVVDYFDEGDLFIFNNTKVFPARLYGSKEK